MIKVYDNTDSAFDKLIESARLMTEKSYAPYSKFNVGAAVLLENGTIITGSNQENAAYGDCLCAERVAILYATANHPDVKPVAIAIAARTKEGFTKECVKPCGSCCQVMLEIESRYKSDLKIIMYGTDRSYIADSVKDLMPFNFGCEMLKP